MIGTERFRRLVMWGMAASALLAGRADAAFVTYNSRAAFDVDAPGLPVETFEINNAAPDSVTIFAEPLDSTSNNAAFSPGQILPGISLAVEGAGTELVLLTQGFAGAPSDMVGPNAFTDALRISFVPGVNAVGFDLFFLNVPGTANVNFFGVSGLLGSVNVATGAAGTFVGAINTTGLIVAVTISDPVPAFLGELIDNVAFGRVVPEPASLALCSLGLISLAAVRVRRRRR